MGKIALTYMRERRKGFHTHVSLSLHGSECLWIEFIFGRIYICSKPCLERGEYVQERKIPIVRWPIKMSIEQAKEKEWTREQEKEHRTVRTHKWARVSKMSVLYCMGDSSMCVVYKIYPLCRTVFERVCVFTLMMLLIIITGASRLLCCYSTP